MVDPEGFPIRTRPDNRDIERISRLHGRLYAEEFGYGRTFEDHVYGLLEDLLPLDEERERFWVAENQGDIVGCVAVAKDGERARLRFLLVDPIVRGHGLGSRLLDLGVQFASERGYGSIFLTTQSNLDGAGKLYRSKGFQLEWEREEVKWGHSLTERCYRMDL